MQQGFMWCIYFLIILFKETKMTRCENRTYRPVSDFDGHLSIFSCFYCVFGDYMFKRHFLFRKENVLRYGSQREFGFVHAYLWGRFARKPSVLQQWETHGRKTIPMIGWITVEVKRLKKYEVCSVVPSLNPQT